MFLINNIQRAMEMHKGLSESGHSPAELITGRFDGIKVFMCFFFSNSFQNLYYVLGFHKLENVFFKRQGINFLNNCLKFIYLGVK